MESILDNAINNEVIVQFNQGYKCQVCSISLNAPSQAAQHLSGSNHTKKFKNTALWARLGKPAFYSIPPIPTKKKRQSMCDSSLVEDILVVRADEDIPNLF